MGLGFPMAPSLVVYDFHEFLNNAAISIISYSDDVVTFDHACEDSRSHYSKDPVTL